MAPPRDDVLALVRRAEVEDLAASDVREQLLDRLAEWEASDPGPPDEVRAIRAELERSSTEDMEELRAQLSLLERTLAG